MTFKTIVAIIQGEKDEDRLLDCVLPIATHFKSHVIGVHAEAMPVSYTTPMGFPDAEFIHVSSERNEKRAADLGHRYSSRCLAEGVSAEWRSLESFSGSGIVHRPVLSGLDSGTVNDFNYTDRCNQAKVIKLACRRAGSSIGGCKGEQQPCPCCNCCVQRCPS